MVISNTVEVNRSYVALYRRNVPTKKGYLACAQDTANCSNNRALDKGKELQIFFIFSWGNRTKLKLLEYLELACVWLETKILQKTRQI